MSKQLPFGWSRVRPWSWHVEERSAQKTVRLSNGDFLRFQIDVSPWYYWADDECTVWVEESMIQPALLAYSGRYHDGLHDKEGTATGPGGVEVLEIGLELLRQSEWVGLTMATLPQVTYEVEAASPKLFNIYRRYLEPRGYTYHNYSEVDVLRKTLREESA